MLACVYIQDAIILVVCTTGIAEAISISGIGIKQLGFTKYNLYII